MNSDTQEDAHEFINLIAQVAQEQPDMNIQELFEAEFAEPASLRMWKHKDLRQQTLLHSSQK